MEDKQNKDETGLRLADAMTVKEAAAAFAVTEETVIRWVRVQNCPAYCTDPEKNRRNASPRYLRFRFNKVLNWLESHAAF